MIFGKRKIEEENSPPIQKSAMENYIESIKGTTIRKKTKTIVADSTQSLDDLIQTFTTDLFGRGVDIQYVTPFESMGKIWFSAMIVWTQREPIEEK
jgi:hypothetical protein